MNPYPYPYPYPYTYTYTYTYTVLDGGLTLGLTTSLASRDLHEVLYEELLECTFPNEVAPGTTVGAMTFVLSREEYVISYVDKC